MKKTVILSLLVLAIWQFNSLFFPANAQEIIVQQVSNLSISLKVNHILQTENPSMLLVATNKGVYSTDDRGESWIQLEKGLPNGEVVRLFYQPQPYMVFASVKNAGIWKWQPAGKNWVSYNSNLPAKQILSFTKTEKYIYAGSDKEGLFRVKIGAERWQDLNFDDKNPFLYQLKIRDIYFSDEKTGWLATDKGIVNTDNEGELWKLQESSTLSNTSLLTFFTLSEKKLFLVGTENKGIFSSEDSGRTWKEWRTGGLPSLPYSAITITSQSGNHNLWVGTEKGIWVSNDDMNQFESLPILSDMIIRNICQSNLDEWEVLWIGTEQNGLYHAFTVKPPSKPLELTYTIGKKAVHLSWKESIPGTGIVTGYTIYRKENPEDPFQPIGQSKTFTWSDIQVEWLNTYYYAIQAFDQNTPPSRSSLSNMIQVLVDDEPLLVINYPPPDYETTDEIIKIEGKALDEGSGVQQVNLIITYPSLPARTYQVTVQPDGAFEQTASLEIGKNIFSIEVLDNRSHQSKQTRTIFRKEASKDIKPPVITITFPADHFVLETSSILVSGKITDEENHLLESRLWVEQGNNRLFYRVLTLDQNGQFKETASIPFGEISIHIQAIDAFGNQSETILNGTNSEPDLIPPHYYILSPLYGTETEDEQIRFYGRAWDEESGIQSLQVSLDYLSKRMYDKTLAINEQGFFDLLVPLMEGENYLSLQVLDKKNNESKETRMVIRKAKPKTILIELVIGKNAALVNGEIIPLLYPPEIKKGRTFVPVRFVSEAFGANVLWIAQRKEIQITWKDRFITFWLNKTIVTIESLLNPNEIPTTEFLEYPPYLAKGVTMVPLRLIAEQFGIAPQWDPDTQTITLQLIP